SKLLVNYIDIFIKKDRKFAGQRVPALDEFLKFAEQYDNLLLNIEFKDNSMELVDKAMTLFREHKLTGRCVFASFYSEIVGYCYDAYGVRTQGFSKHNFTTFIDGEDGTISKMYAVGLGVDEVTKEVVADYEKNGIQPWAWCPDDEQSVKHCLSCGIKLLTCNDVAAALKIVKNR
ncbi:MAG: glycerophosphodiester phosphodiesterase, partial [Oscillospiraceae bacterium]